MSYKIEKCKGEVINLIFVVVHSLASCRIIQIYGDAAFRHQDVDRLPRRRRRCDPSTTLGYFLLASLVTTMASKNGVGTVKFMP